MGCRPFDYSNNAESVSKKQSSEQTLIFIAIEYAQYNYWGTIKCQVQHKEQNYNHKFGR